MSSVENVCRSPLVFELFLNSQREELAYVINAAIGRLVGYCATLVSTCLENEHNCIPFSINGI